VESPARHGVDLPAVEAVPLLIDISGVPVDEPLNIKH